MVGTGQFGSVRLVRHAPTGNLFALKVRPTRFPTRYPLSADPRGRHGREQREHPLISHSAARRLDWQVISPVCTVLVFHFLISGGAPRDIMGRMELRGQSAPQSH